MVNYFSSDFKLAILGGGQLGKMLLYETRKYDIHTLVLDPSDEAPSKISCNYFEEGDLMDYDTVLRFGRKADVVTFEIEGINIEALKQLESEGIKTYPSPATLEKIQNKAVQECVYRISSSKITFLPLRSWFKPKSVFTFPVLSVPS